MQHDNSNQPDYGASQALVNGFRVIEGKTAKSANKTRLQKLSESGYLTFEARCTCEWLANLYERSKPSHVTVLGKEMESMGYASTDSMEVNRMSALDDFNFIMRHMPKTKSNGRDLALLIAVCVDEMTVSRAFLYCSVRCRKENQRKHFHHAADMVEEARILLAKKKRGEYVEEHPKPSFRLTGTENELISG